MQLGGGGTLTVLVTTGDGKHCRAESEAAQAVAAPRWQFETSLGLPAVGKPPHHSDSEAMVQFSVHRRHFLATEVVGSAAVQLATLKGAGARHRALDRALRRPHERLTPGSLCADQRTHQLSLPLSHPAAAGEAPSATKPATLDVRLLLADYNALRSVAIGGEPVSEAWTAAVEPAGDLGSETGSESGDLGRFRAAPALSQPAASEAVIVLTASAAAAAEAETANARRQAAEAQRALYRLLEMGIEENVGLERDLALISQAMSEASLGEAAAAGRGGQGASQRVQGSSAAEKAEHSRLHTELQRLSAAQAQLHAQLERGKGELAVVNQQLAGAKFVHNVYSSKVKRMVSERRQISDQISAMEQERAGLQSALNEQRPGRPDDARRALSSAAEDSVAQHLRQLEEAEARHQHVMHASKNAHLSKLREIQADFVKGIAPGSTPSGSSAYAPGGATASGVDAAAATAGEAGEADLGATAAAGQATRATAALDKEVQRLQARLVAREEALAAGEEELLQLRAERVATRAELTQAEASMLSVMEELSRKAQALSAVRQQAQPCPPKGTAARHPPCAWGWHRAALGIAQEHEPREGPRLGDATLA